MLGIIRIRAEGIASMQFVGIECTKVMRERLILRDAIAPETCNASSRMCSCHTVLMTRESESIIRSRGKSLSGYTLRAILLCFKRARLSNPAGLFTILRLMRDTHCTAALRVSSAVYLVQPAFTDFSHLIMRALSKFRR